MNKFKSLFFITLFAFFLFFSCSEKKETITPDEKNRKSDSSSLKIQTETPEKNTVQIPEFKESDISDFLNNIESVSGIDAEYTQKINEAKDKKYEMEKLLKEREYRISEYLKGKNIDPKDYILKASKIMKAFIGIQLSEDEELLKTQIEYVKKSETDPLKQQENINMAKEISSKVAQKYLEEINDSEKELIRKHKKELEEALANKKVKIK